MGGIRNGLCHGDLTRIPIKNAFNTRIFHTYHDNHSHTQDMETRNNS